MYILIYIYHIYVYTTTVEYKYDIYTPVSHLSCVCLVGEFSLVDCYKVERGLGAGNTVLVWWRPNC